MSVKIQEITGTVHCPDRNLPVHKIKRDEQSMNSIYEKIHQRSKVVADAF